MRANALILAAALVLVAIACSATAPSPQPSHPAVSDPATAIASLATKDANTLRLLVLGDSIAIPGMGCGDCEGFDRRYATHLEGLSGRSVELTNQARPNAQIRDLQGLLDSDRDVQDAIAIPLSDGRVLIAGHWDGAVQSTSSNPAGPTTEVFQ